MKVSTAWILFKIIDEVDTSTVNCQLSTVHCESAKFQFITMPQAGFSVEQHGTALVDITKSRCYFANCLLHFLIFVV